MYTFFLIKKNHSSYRDTPQCALQDLTPVIVQLKSTYYIVG